PQPRPPLFPYTTLFRSQAHRPALEAAVAGVDEYEVLLAAQIDRLAGDQQADSGGHPDLAGDEHLGLQPALGVGERAAHLDGPRLDRKSTRLNSSHVSIS